MNFVMYTLVFHWIVLPLSGNLLPIDIAFLKPAGPPQSRPALPAPQPRKTFDINAIIRSAAEKHHVPAAFVKSIIAAESNFNGNATSPKGALGLMQLMPQTAAQYGADPRNPEQNVDAGTHYLRVLMDRYRRFGNSMTRVIAAYNAGPGKVDRYHGVPPFRETRRYVVRVLGFFQRYQKELA
jgi:soluble lytic murein transglycosylase-like protein